MVVYHDEPSEPIHFLDPTFLLKYHHLDWAVTTFLRVCQELERSLVVTDSVRRRMCFSAVCAVFGGPDGTYRDHWHSYCRKKPSSRVIFVLGAMLIFQCRSTRDPRFVCVILAPEACNFSRIVVKKLKERVAPLVLPCRIEKCQIFPPLPTFSNYACHPCTWVMPKASNPWRAITKKKQGPHYLSSSSSSSKNTVCTCHPCTKGHAKFLCAKKKKTCH